MLQKGSLEQVSPLSASRTELTPQTLSRCTGERCSELEDLLEDLSRREILVMRPPVAHCRPEFGKSWSCRLPHLQGYESLMSVSDKVSATPRSESVTFSSWWVRSPAGHPFTMRGITRPQTQPSLPPQADDASRSRAALSDPSRK